MVVTEPMIKIRTFDAPENFLQAVRTELEFREAANSLALGISGQLVKHPEWFSSAPVFRTGEENGRLVLATVMTPPNNLTVSSGRWVPSDDGIRQFMEALFREGWKLPGVSGPAELAGRFAEEWNELSGTHHRVDERLRIYELKEVVIPSSGRGNLRAAGAGDFEIVAKWWHAARMEMFGKSEASEDRLTAKYRIDDGDVFLWDDDGPVSMACRTRPTRRGISVGMVYTPPEARRRGYATACVAELSRTLLRSGWDFCSLFADILNPVSNNIYQKIGYRPIGEFTVYTFEEKG
jgi:uncharacterized protein